MFRTSSLIVAAASLAACAGASRDVTPSAKPPQLSQEEMTKRMTELATPGPNHKRLDPMVGTFSVKLHMWEAPGAKEQVSEGTDVSEWVWDGRFVKTKFESDFNGQPFHGGGLTGFDNSSGKYQAFWVDSMGTMMMPIATGTLDPNGKSITFTRSMIDPMTGTPITTREVATIVDADHHTFEWFQPGPDGKEFRMMFIEYVRKK